MVVHLDEGGDAKHEVVVRNVANLLDDLGGIPVEVVTHGSGIGLCLPGSPHAEAVQALMARGVVVAACENTLRSQDMDRGRLAEGVVTVPSGVGELVRRQHQGWAYVRP